MQVREGERELIFCFESFSEVDVAKKKKREKTHTFFFCYFQKKTSKQDGRHHGDRHH